MVVFPLLNPRPEDSKGGRPLRGECARGLAPSAEAGRHASEPSRDGGWFNSPALHQIIQSSMGSPALFLNKLALLNHEPPL
jgi:hypothetical protein